MADTTPLIDRAQLEDQFNGYDPAKVPANLPNIPYSPLESPTPNTEGIGGNTSNKSSLKNLENYALSSGGKDNGTFGGSIQRPLSELTSDRYNNFTPDYNNEDAYAQGQGWTSKMVSGVGKGLLLTGTTFLQTTLGTVNGVARFINDGRAASFYDNDFNKKIDEINKEAENLLPNYYTDVEKNAAWYSPSKTLTANFLWDGIVKNLGFSAGAALSGGLYTGILRSLPLTSRLFSIGKAAEALAATEEGLLSANKVADTYGKVKSLSDKFLSSYNLLNPGGRALIAGLSTTGEAGFEAYNNLNEFRNNRIAEYKSSHFGQEPTGEDLNKINTLADGVGNSSFLLNVGLLSATNYIQFPKILGSSYKTEKGIVNSVSKEIKDISKNAVGEFAEKTVSSRGGKLLSSLDNARKYFFSTSEGFEEGAQYAIQTGTQDYYNKKYNNKPTNFLESLAEGVTQTLTTDEGMQNVLIGGLSGALMMARGNIKENKEIKENTADAIQKFNNYTLSDFTKESIDGINRGTTLQEEREQAIKDGNIAKSKDLEADYIINYLSPRIKYGRWDLVNSDIQDYKSLAMSDEGFAQLQAEGKALPEDTRASYLSRINSLEQTATHVKSLYQSLNLRYGNYIDSEGKPLYSSEVMDKMVYSASKVADYDKRIPQISNSLIIAGIDTGSIVDDIIINGEPKEEVVKNAVDEINKLNILEDEKNDLKDNLIDLIDNSINRQQFLKEYNDIKNSPSSYKEVKTSPPTEGEAPTTISVKTKDGEEEINVGEEYFLGRVTEKNEKGNDVYRAPRLTILGENEDGTIKIKTSNGIIRDISKKELESYKLGKVSDTLNNKKAKFFMENWNTVYEFNFGKNKKVPGRLEYSPKDRILIFTYKNKQGKIKSIEVTGDQFEPQKGFKEAMITPIGKLTIAQETSQKEFSKEKDDRIEKKREARLEILNTLFDDLSNKKESSSKLIEQKRKELENIQGELNSLRGEIENAEIDQRSKKSVRFKSATKTALKSAMRLSRLQEQLENEIQALEAEGEEIEFTLSYVADMAQNIDELPTDSKEFLEELNSQQLDLEILRETNAKQINIISQILKETEKAFNSAVNFLSDLISKFENKYPNVPRIMGQEYVDFLQSNPNFLKLKPNYREELSEIDDSIAFIEEGEITPSENKIKELNDHLSIIHEELNNLQKEIDAKQIIIDRVQEIADRYKEQKEQEEKAIRDESLLQQFLGTLSTDVQPISETKNYEPASKKSPLSVVGGTINPNDKKPFTLRANRFGSRFHSLKNSSRIKGIVVTQKTEGSILPGLMAHLAEGSTADTSTTIALVMVEENPDGTVSLVNEQGIPIYENRLEQAIFQVFPLPKGENKKLEATYSGNKESMFPNDTPEHIVNSLEEQYDEWRNNILSQEELPAAEGINASFGIPEYVTNKDENGNDIPDYDAQTSVEEAGLIPSLTALEKNRVIKLATTNETVSNGSMTFTTPKGRVFLEVAGGLVKLFNKKLDSKKANSVYEVIHQLSKNITGEEGIRSKNSKQLIDYLKSVVYWGIAHDQETGKRKPAGYNNIWFEKVYDEDYKKDVYKLFISGKGEGFYFTPTTIENNKENILLLLKNIYHNTNASLANDNNFNAPYYEIVGIKEDGSPIPKKWANYQTYLLSSEGRKNDEIPLTTPIRPLENKDDVNRKGIYFTLNSTADNFIIPQEPPIVKNEPIQKPSEETSSTNTPVIPAKENNASTGFKLDGETKNVIDNPTLGKIVFAATKEGKILFFQDEDGNLDEDTQKAVDTLAEQKNITKEKAKGIIAASIIQKLQPQIIGEQIPEEPPLQNEEAPKESAFKKRKRNLFSPDDTAYRLQINKEIKKFQGENWEKFEAFLKEKFPNIPVYRIKNIIQATNGRQAWGMLQDGAIYVYEGAEIGTGYHEVFEAIWKMFSPYKEQQAILNEFKTRKGEFQDRVTGERIKYSEASPQEIKEELAEEFREFILDGKNVYTAPKGFISKMFHDLWNFIKEFFTGEKAQKNTQDLFEKIGNGYYKEYIPYETQLSYAVKGIQDIDYVKANDDAEFKIKTIPADQTHEIMQHLTWALLTSLTRNNKSLFSIPKINKESFYNKLQVDTLAMIGHPADLIEESIKRGEIQTEEAKKRYNDIGSLYDSVENEWGAIVKKHEEYLKTYSIEFDENGESILNDEDNSGKSDYQDSRKIDSFRNMNSSIKLLLATLPQVNDKGKIVFNSIGGVNLVNSDKVYITLMNKLHSSVNLDDMLEKLRIMALNDPIYIALYNRVTKSNYLVAGVNWQQLKETYDSQLLTGIWKTFKKQNADVKTVFIFPTGEIEFTDSALSSVARQNRFEMFNNVISKIKSDNKYVFYNTKTKKYEATPLAKTYKLDSGKLETYTAFLKEIGIDFNPQELRKLKLPEFNSAAKAFRGATEGIKESVSKYKDVVSFNKRSLNMEGRLLALATVKAALNNSEFESTYFNVNGDRVQTFLGPNAISNLYDVISKLKNINELSDTPYSYLLTDVFTKGSSSVLNSMFTSDGERIENTENILHYGMVDGTVNETNNKKKESSRLQYKERIIQELNANLEGWYMNLVPGDASIEGMVFLDNPISTKMLGYGFTEVEDIFEKYFLSEIGLSRENRKIVEIGDRKSTDLRFLKPILGDSLHNKIINSKNSKLSPEELYKEYKKEINSAIKEFIKKDVEERRETLSQYGIVIEDGEGMKVENLAFAQEGNITEEELHSQLEALSVNYIIANIELHKLIYSDPYQYKDELKRIKNFGSPRQSVISNSSNMGELMNRVYNKDYSPEDIGFSDMSEEHMNSVSIDDVFSSNELPNYDVWKETDGGGYISQKANRKFRIRASDWSEEEEQQYKYDVAYEKKVKNIPLSDSEQKLLKQNIDVRSAYTPLKPIVTGNKDDGKNYNDIAVHKFALVPLSFRLLHELNPDSNAIKFYNKMQEENIDYALYNSSVKVGAGALSSLYNVNGDFNAAPFNEINKIPFSIIGVQQEVPSKDTPVVTQGSQITKLATLDFMQAGTPIDYFPDLSFEDRWEKWNSLLEADRLKSSEIYREIKNNQTILEERIKEGYNSLLRKLGISSTKKGFIISDIDKLIDTLSNEILKREVNDNISEAFEGFKKGDVVLEATPAYQQIRNILYSISDRNVVRPKISGGLKVQIPSTLLESSRTPIEIKEINGKQAYTSDVLRFYTDEEGKRTCEIMISRWFDSSMSDEELLTYLNTTPEGKKILGGIGFRIPTQKQNSIEVFKVKQFLPNGFGDSVVVPSALVNKVGSDFDIDKLSIYLKNVFENAEGRIQMIPHFKNSEEARNAAEDIFDEILGGKINKLQQKEAKLVNLQSILSDILTGKASEKRINKWTPILKNMFGNSAIDIEDAIMTRMESVGKKLDKLTDWDLQNILLEEFKDSLYGKSLENDYISSLESLVSHPLNFKQLTKPNSAEQLETLSNKITSLIGEKQFDYSSPGTMLNIKAMSSLRQAFVTGKQAIGIAAVNQTNHAQNQRANIFIDKDRLKGEKISDVDKKWLGNGEINFQEFNSLNGKPSISFIENAKGEYISDIIGQFIDGYVDVANGPWIMQLGAKPNVASTWLFLIKLGVPINTVAYFMNQPIVRDYLRNIESKGYSWLFIEDIVNDMLDVYSPQSNINVTSLPTEKEMEKMLSLKKKDMTDVQIAQQGFILEEFLKYAKMSEHLFHVTQGSNFDTATINDPYIVFKKQMQLKKAQNTIISSVDDLLDSSFVGILKNVIYDVRDAYSTILISDRKNVRGVIEEALLPFVDMNDRDFTKLAQKTVNDLFDWAVQNDRGLNTQISNILLSKEDRTSVAQEVVDFANKVKDDKSHPLYNNVILNSIKRIAGSKPLTPDNLQILGRDSKVYDQNQIIYGFNELKRGLVGSDAKIYGKLVRLAVLQSGLTKSGISFTSLLPYEDFKEIYNETLSALEKSPILDKFNELNVIQRNNWNNTDMIPNMKAQWIKSKKSGDWFYNIGIKFLNKNITNAINRGDIPQLLKLSPFSREGSSDFVVYSYENQLSTNKEKNKQLKKEARKNGDTSYINRWLFKKVYDSNGKPLMHVSQTGDTIYKDYVYKAINAWGYSYKANEFYSQPLPSVIDNDFKKIYSRTELDEENNEKKFSGEVKDNIIENIVNKTSNSKKVFLPLENTTLTTNDFKCK